MLNRRAMMRVLGTGSLVGSAGLIGQRAGAAERQFARATNGLPKLKITNVKAIPTRPDRARLVVVKVETSELGLYGLGCATFNQRAQTVAVAVDKFLASFAEDRNPDNIEDMWRTAYTSRLLAKWAGAEQRVKLENSDTLTPRSCNTQLTGCLC